MLKFAKLREVKITNWIGFVFLTLIMIGTLTGCKGEEEKPLKSLSTSVVPAEFEKGEVAFNSYCAECHGEKGSGSKEGPSFIDKIYKPNHHGDMSFLLAVKNGVRAHHWRFGNMPKILGVTEKEVKEIVEYVRWLQRDAVIY